MEVKMTPIQNSYMLNEISIEITRKCPLNCLHCSSEGGEPLNDELTIKDWKQIINNSIELGSSIVSFSGGEPLDYQEFIELVKFAKSKGLKVYVYTCGNIHSKKDLGAVSIKQLKQLKKLRVDKLIYNVQGSSSHIHDSITGKYKSFQNVFKSIRESVSLGLYTEIHFVPMKINYQEIERTVKLARESNVNKVSFLRFVPQGRGEKYKNKLQLEGNEIYNLRKILQRVRQNSDNIRLGAPFNCFLIDNDSKCSAGKDKILIKPEGTVVPCVAFKNVSNFNNGNNVREKSLKDIWENSEIFETIRKVSKNESYCSKCDSFNLCNGGCPAQKSLAYQDFYNNADPYCLTNSGLHI
jgi:radical SAM protein with 4Fe4S-binding SPASM domain